MSLDEQNYNGFQHASKPTCWQLPGWWLGVNWGGQLEIKLGLCLLLMISSLCATSGVLTAHAQKIPQSIDINELSTGTTTPVLGTPLQGSATFKENVEEDPLSPFYYPTDPDVMESHPLKSWTDSLPSINELKNQLQQNPDNAEINYQLGMKYYYLAHSDHAVVQEKASKIYDQAIQHFLNAQRFDPDSIPIRLGLGTAYLAQDRLEDAGELFERALETDPYNPDVLERTGAYLSRQGNFTAAKAYLQKATELKQNHATAYFYQGFTVAKKQAIFKSQKTTDNALNSLQTAQHMHPQDPATLALLGHQQKYKGNTGIATKYYQDALSTRPGYLPASLGLADIYKDNGDLENELDILKKAVHIHPNNDPVKIRIGDLYWKNGQLDLAAHYYQKILMNHPDDTLAKKALADVRQEKMYRERLGSQGWSTATYNAGEYGLDSKPGLMNVSQSGSVRNSGFVPVSAGQRSQSEYTGGLNETAGNHHQRFQQAELYLDRYQFEAAETAILQAIKSTSTGQEAYQYGQILTEMGLPDMAIQAFEKSKRLDPLFNNKSTVEIARAHQRLNASLEAQNSAGLNSKKAPDSAEQILINALSYDIRNAEAHYQLATIQEQKENYREAINHYYAFTQLKPTDMRNEKILKKIEKLKYK